MSAVIAALENLPGPVLSRAIPDARVFASVTAGRPVSRMSVPELFANVTARYPGGLPAFLRDVSVPVDGSEYPDLCSWCERTAIHALGTLDRRCDLHDRIYFGPHNRPRHLSLVSTERSTPPMSTRHPLDRSTSVRVFAVHPSRLDPPAVACVGDGRRVVFARTDATPDQIGAAVLNAQAHDMPHAHTYRADMSTHRCSECDTATDYCRQSNPGALGD